jgi:transcriptional regulator with XRE-family HTH domain
MGATTFAGMAKNRKRRPTPGEIRMARLLKELRAEHDMSQADLASAMGVHQSRVSKWEMETGDMGPQHLLRLSDVFKISLRFLCDLNSKDRHEPDPHAVQPEGDRPQAPSDPDEVVLWRIIRKMGPDVALDRLLSIEADQSPRVLRPLGGATLPGRPPRENDPPANHHQKRPAGKNDRGD